MATTLTSCVKRLVTRWRSSTVGKCVDGRLEDRGMVPIVPVLFCFNFVLLLFGIVPLIQYSFFHFI